MHSQVNIYRSKSWYEIVLEIVVDLQWNLVSLYIFTFQFYLLFYLFQLWHIYMSSFWPSHIMQWIFYQIPKINRSTVQRRQYCDNIHDKAIQRKFFEQWKETLKIENPDDWYKISLSFFQKQKDGHFIESVYNGSLVQGTRLYWRSQWRSVTWRLYWRSQWKYNGDCIGDHCPHCSRRS
jgi:hypothetical protein